MDFVQASDGPFDRGMRVRGFSWSSDISAQTVRTSTHLGITSWLVLQHCTVVPTVCAEGECWSTGRYGQIVESTLVLSPM